MYRHEDKLCQDVAMHLSIKWAIKRSANAII